MREPTKTLNRSEVHGWRRFLYSSIYFISVMGWFFCIGFVIVAFKLIIAGFSDHKDDPLHTEYWYLVGPGCFLAGVVLVLINGFIRDKFKREGEPGIDDSLLK